MDAAARNLLVELEPTVAANIDRHLSVAKEWMPHEYVPWALGRDFTDEPWDASQSRLDPITQISFEVNLLTEDNLPSYHRAIDTAFGRDGAWGFWTGQWTAEEGRHSYAMRARSWSATGSRVILPVLRCEIRVASSWNDT